jgi:hypothetical protein
VSKNGESPEAPDHPGHLLCFKAKPIAKHAAVAGIHVADQFGAQVLEAVKPVELCVPSTVAPAPKRAARSALRRSLPRGKPGIDPCEQNEPPPEP